MTLTVITGATGFVGRHLLWDLLKQARPGDRVVALIRARSQPEAEDRLQVLLDDPSSGLSLDHKAAVEALCGDITRERLGLSGAQDAALWPEVTDIVHCAASVQFTLDLATSRRINVDGTRRMLEGARRSRGLRRLDYVGTAYVSGRRTGLVREDELDAGGSFHNPYEQSKAEAEALVRAAACDLPVTIFRPSIIVGDSTTGMTQSFKVLYWPLKVLSRRLVVCIPADRHGVVDIVPIDFVRDAIGHIRATAPPRGRTYHITCGPQNTATVETLARIAADKFGVRRPPFVSPRYVYPVLEPVLKAVLFGEPGRVIRTGAQYLPYLSHHAVFDTTNTTSALAGSGLAALPPAEYFGRLIEYCIASDWGRRAVP